MFARLFASALLATLLPLNVCVAQTNGSNSSLPQPREAAANPQPPKSAAPQPEAVLRPSDTASLLPPAVFYRGQSGTVQSRNSGGVRFADGALMLATLVDTSGYSSTVTQKYQAYLLTEVPLAIGGHSLPPGAYGFGFIAGNKFVLMDIGGHDLLTATYDHDSVLRRPTPLQVLPSEAAGQYRLCSGRNYVTFSRAGPSTQK